MNGKQWLLPGLGVIILLAFVLLPPVGALTPLGMKVFGIFLFTTIWWAALGIGFPSFVSLVLIALLGVMTPTEVFAASWGNWLILFLIGSFGLSEGLRASGFSRRFALWFITLPFVAGHPWRLLSMFLLACTLLGGILSLTVTCVVFMAIAEPMLAALGYKRGDPFAAMLMMAIGWSATASSAMTPISHATNLAIMDFVQKDTGRPMSWVLWMVAGIPLALLTLGMLLLFYRYVVRPDLSKFGAMAVDYVRAEAAKMGRMKPEEKVAVAVVLLVIALWTLPSVAGNALPDVSAYLNNMGYVIPALGGGSLLCLIRVKNRPIISFRDWMVGVEWDTVALCGGIMALTEIIGNPKTGIIQFLGDIFRPIATGAPFFVFLMIILFWAIVQTNMMSNLVSATTVYRVMIPVAIAAGVGNPVAMAFIIAAGANYAFALPSATTSTALVTGSGWVPVGFMFKYGLLLIIPIVLLLTFIGYPLAALIFR